jgi:2,3-dihydroxybenzoate decarboxylase
LLQKPNVPVVALEEHYADPELYALFTGLDATTPPPVVEKLKDTGAARLKDMDAAGIDVQVLSHSAPSLQKISSGAVELARRINDRLAEIIKTAPTRYAGFAALPTHDPAAAADELARCVEKLGFKGAMIHGLAEGQFIDDKRYWPIFARAEALDVPIYLHPSMPHPAVIDAYYKEYAKDFPVLLRNPPRALRPVRAAPHEIHPRPSRRRPAVPRLAYQQRAGAAGAEAGAVPRHFLFALLHHHKRFLLRSSAPAVRAGNGHRSHPVRGRLSVRGKRAGTGLACTRAALR